MKCVLETLRFSSLEFVSGCEFGIKMAYQENFQQKSEPKYDCLLFGKETD